ncbi:MAG TPA: hypothetical protein VM099_00775 [Gemmatimonadaceae bacterium]|nr:hypothetical protein [Gemmatimonadaceae bacterium]
MIRIVSSSQVDQRLLAILIGAVLLAGCEGKGDKPAIDTTIATSTAPAPESGGPRGLGGAPGTDPTSTLTYYRTLDFTKPQLKDDYVEGPIDCDKPSDCGGRNTITLLIVPEKMAHKVNWIKSVSATETDGHFVAMIVNKDNVTFTPFHLAPRDTAFEWVGPLYATPDSRKALAFYKINTSTGTLRGGPYGETKFRTCPYQTNDHAAVHFNKKHCPDSAASVLYPLDTGKQATALAPPMPQDGGLWVSCDNGCCQIGNEARWYRIAPSDTAKAK